MVADISWHSSRGSDPIPLVVVVMVRHAFCIMPVRSCLNGHVLQAAICLCEIDSLQAMREEGLISPGCRLDWYRRLATAFPPSATVACLAPGSALLTSAARFLLTLVTAALAGPL